MSQLLEHTRQNIRRSRLARTSSAALNIAFEALKASLAAERRNGLNRDADRIEQPSGTSPHGADPIL